MAIPFQMIQLSSNLFFNAVGLYTIVPFKLFIVRTNPIDQSHMNHISYSCHNLLICLSCIGLCGGDVFGWIHQVQDHPKAD